MEMKYKVMMDSEYGRGKVYKTCNTLKMALETFDDVLKKRIQSKDEGSFYCSVYAIENDLLNEIDFTDEESFVHMRGSRRASALDTKRHSENMGYMVADNGNGFCVLATDKENAASILREVSNNYYAVDTSVQNYWV